MVDLPTSCKLTDEVMVSFIPYTGTHTFPATCYTTVVVNVAVASHIWGSCNYNGAMVQCSCAHLPTSCKLTDEVMVSFIPYTGTHTFPATCYTTVVVNVAVASHIWGSCNYNGAMVQCSCAHLPTSCQLTDEVMVSFIPYTGTHTFPATCYTTVVVNVAVASHIWGSCNYNGAMVQCSCAHLPTSCQLTD